MSNLCIGLGVTGSVSAYKAAYLLRLCTQAGIDVRPILSPSAEKFLGAQTLSSLSGHRCLTDGWLASESGKVAHVELAHEIDGLVIVPATADTLARLVHGRADDVLGQVALSSKGFKLLAPAMEDGMWRHPATTRNVEALRADGFIVVEPEFGALGSGRVGMGRLAEVETIFQYLQKAANPQPLNGQRWVISAGPTREHLDPARFLSNPSTGKMGYALAQAAWRMGAQVQLVSGPTELRTPVGCERFDVKTTEDMLKLLSKTCRTADTLVMAAAPADFKPQFYSGQKTKKSEGLHAIELNANPDILKTLSKEYPKLKTIGFAAETENLVEYAKAKLQAKGLRAIVANSIGAKSGGFASESNAATLIGPDMQALEFPSQSKASLALNLIEALLERKIV